MEKDLFIKERELEKFATMWIDKNIYAEAHTAFIAGAQMIIEIVNKEKRLK